MEGLAAAKSRSLQYVFVGAAPDSYREAVKVSAQAVTIIGPGASLRPPGADEPGILVQNGSQLVVEDLRIHEVSGTLLADGIRCEAGGGSVTLRRVTLEGNAGQGVDVGSCSATVNESTVKGNAGGGITSTNGTVTVERSKISNNSAGGIALNVSAFTVRNCYIFENGNTGAVSGGVVITGNSPAAKAFEFNTLTGNTGPIGQPSGVVCALQTSPMPFSSNIVFDNQGSTQQVDGDDCSWTYSVIGPASQSGVGNISASPQFMNPGQDDYHIAGSSPAKDAADPGASLAVDFDGDVRPQPTGGRRDIGADEVVQ